MAKIIAFLWIVILGTIGSILGLDISINKGDNILSQVENDKGQQKVYRWVIREEEVAPDNYAFNCITINGRYPGPTIEANVYDTIIVEVYNKLKRDFTIHWHGMLQHKTVNMDGVPFVTQPPIPPNGFYRYRFDVTDQAGTWWYHAHTGLDSEQCNGALIVKDDKEVYNDLVQTDKTFAYDDERTLMFSELWHKTTQELLEGLKGSPFKWVGSADSIVTNGKTFKVWDPYGKDNSTVPMNNGYETLDVQQNKRYRLRLIGGMGTDLLNFKIQGHKFWIIEADGIYVKPFEMESIDISPGQRYSVIFETNQKVDNYYMCAQPTESNKTCSTGASFLHYLGAEEVDTKTFHNVPGNNAHLTEWEVNLHTNKWYEKGLVEHFYPVPKRPNKFIHLKVAEGSDDKNRTFFTVNGHKHVDRNTTLWDEVLANRYSGSEPGVIDINEGDQVQIVFDQYAVKGENPGCGVHPWHLHGHLYWVVGAGPGAYNHYIDLPKLNRKLGRATELPILRDTFTHFPESTKPGNLLAAPGFGPLKVALPSNTTFLNRPNINLMNTPNEYTPCGWYAIRFIANNPGSWYMHCHITPHLIMGKQVIINEHKKKRYY